MKCYWLFVIFHGFIGECLKLVLVINSVRRNIRSVLCEKGEGVGCSGSGDCRCLEEVFSN